MSCLLCGQGELSDRHTIGRYRIRTCRACNLTQLDPPPPPETALETYGNGYFEGSGDIGYSEYAAQEEEYRATFAEELRHLAPFVRPGGQVLDVGCGFGWFVQEAMAAGYDAVGMDLSREAVERASLMLPGRIFHGSLEAADELQGRHFDLVFASHVIEHIAEPHAFVARLTALLREDGIIALVTPNIDSVLARVSGKRWVSFKIPEHVAYYAPNTMTQLLESAGLEVLAIQPAYQYYALPFIMQRVRELLRPLDRLLPRLEERAPLRSRRLRITSGSLRAIARRRPQPGPAAPAETPLSGGSR